MVFGLISWLVFSDVDSDKPFESVELSYNNTISNGLFPKYIDTVLHVGLDVAGVKGVTVVINQLTDEAKSNFSSGELKAHIRYFNGIFYLFTNEMSRKESIEVMSHEIIHIKQYNDGILVYENNEVYWNGQLFLLEDVDYDNRPWEREAFSLQSDVSNQISEILIK